MEESNLLEAPVTKTSGADFFSTLGEEIFLYVIGSIPCVKYTAFRL